MYELRQIRSHRDGFVLEVEECDLAPRTTYAIVGPNGSGKSTFLDLLALLREPAAGTYRFAGGKVAWSDRSGLLAQRRRIAYLMQTPYLFSTTVSGNIAYGLELRGLGGDEIERRVREVAAALSLDSLLGRSARRLSGGEAQRVALARALVLDADVYLLDEPTANVDRQHVHRVEELVRETSRRRGATVVLTTHSTNQASRLTAHHLSIIDGRLGAAAYENVLSGHLRLEPDGVRTAVLPGGVELKVAAGEPGPVTLAIDPEHLILSAEELESSALNRLQGRVTRAEDAGDSLRVYIDAGVPLCARVTVRSFEGMRLRVGGEVWVTFKATAVRVL